MKETPLPLLVGKGMALALGMMGILGRSGRLVALVRLAWLLTR